MQSKYTDDLLDQAIQYMESRSTQKYSREDARAALDGIVKFFDILARWEAKEKANKPQQTLCNIKLKTIGQPFYFRFNRPLN